MEKNYKNFENKNLNTKKYAKNSLLKYIFKDKFLQINYYYF